MIKANTEYPVIPIILLNLMGLFLNSCTPIPKAIPTANTTFTVSAPNRFDCYTQHQGPGVPATRVTILVNLTTYYYDGTRKVTLDDKSLLVNPNTTPFPVSITALMPSGTVPGYWEINMVGQECAECANYWSAPNETPYGSCPSGMIDPNHPYSFIAAKPRWLGTKIVQHYFATLDVSANPFMNVPNSCGCEVQ